MSFPTLSAWGDELRHPQKPAGDVSHLQVKPNVTNLFEMRYSESLLSGMASIPLGRHGTNCNKIVIINNLIWMALPSCLGLRTFFLGNWGEGCSEDPLG
ncbi:hypothetical protein [Gloeomargarita sp.]